MKKQIFALGLLSISTFALAQGSYGKADLDTIRVQQIEDVQLHKTGNPNKAKVQALKSNLTVMETPQPIAIVTHEIIEQQQAKQLSDVLQNVNGVYITSSRGNSQDSFGGRGFSLGNDNIFKNGARVNSGVFPEVSGLERVEVLKGANAMMYGNTAAGGVINMVTKKPRFNFGGSGSLSVGSWNTYKPTVDVYGPLSKNVAARVNMAYENAESFRDVVKSEKYYINPSFLFNLGSKSQLIVEADYFKNNSTPDFGIGAITEKDSSYKLIDFLPRNTFFGTDWQYQNVQQASTNVTFNHQINDKWIVNASASYQNYTKDYFSTERIQWSYNSSNRLQWNRPLNKAYNEQNYGSVQVNLTGEFNTGKITHKILVGGDADYNSTDSYTYYDPTKPGTPKNNQYGTGYIWGTNGLATGGTIFLDNPSTWAGGEIPSAERIANFEKNRVNSRRIGFYAQDFIGLTNQFKLIAGLRWSYVESMPTIKTEFTKNTKTFSSSTVSDNAISPKIGFVYMPNDNLSVFATYTNSFSTNTGYTSDDIATIDTGNSSQTANEINNSVAAQISNISKKGIRPTTIDQYEIGAKKNLWNNALSVNLSLYQILYNNYYQSYWFINNGTVNGNQSTSVVTPDSNLKEYAGKMRSRGVELDITGNPTKNLSIIGGFSYNNSVYLDTPEKGYEEKQRLVRTPATTANLSLFYTFTNNLKGLKVGAGAYYIGDRLAGWNDSKSTDISRKGVTRTFELKDYTTVSLSAGYEWKKFMIQAKMNNLFDVVNYNVHENYSVNPIAPRNFYLTLTYKL